MAYSFLAPREIVSGRGALESAAKKFSSYGKKALIVTDAMMVKLGNAAVLEQACRENNVDYVIYDGINAEPSDVMILDGLKAYKENHCDFLIALGGGSPIDSAKAIGMMSVSDAPIASYMGKLIDVNMPGLIAIPTTAGTGSEVTKFTIINDTATKVKMLLTGACLIPAMAVIDPKFTMTAPKSVTSHTGIDALCHAVESYTSRKAQPLSETFSLSAIKRIFENLETCYNEPSNEAARIQMSLAATEAGLAFTNASVTIVHGMSRPIGALFHVPHGLSNAMLLEVCMNFAVDGAYDRFADIARYLGFASAKDEDEKAARIFLEKLSGLLRNLHVPTMSEYGIDKDAYFAVIEKMAHDAYASGSPSNTIKEVTVEDMIRLYKEVYR
ncbi:MAG: iron-containing alcohol dehydrogenase [Erysipelotrichales bacterium]|nr:iron-containing alcohol dehydrogenase [Erysipelotrichales bacterium]MBQ2309550.1 iron-containing alcohol dehydrogenase [Erysipelotrichales bacterium]MBQ4374545.1 iron-containing alcohol dehydrogenase [Erysipelotrichales bacterium]